MSTAHYIRRIKGTARLRPKPGANATEIAVDDDGLKVRLKSSVGEVTIVDNTQDQTVGGAKTFSGATTLSGSATLSGAVVGLEKITTTTAETDTLDATDSGTVFVCTASSGTQTFTLPATVSGLRYTFICGHADGEINISPNAADKITGKGFEGSDDGDIKNTAASNAVGDTCTLVGDGADGWIATVVTGTWAVV